MDTETKLTYDDIAKYIFTNHKTGKRYAAELIGTVLEIDPNEIYENLEYIHPQVKYNKNVIGSITDISMKTDKILIDIEINRSGGSKRNVQNEAYLFQLYLGELQSYKDYAKLKPVIQINLDNYDYLKKNDFIYCSMLMDTVYHEITSQYIKIYHINLKLLRKYDNIKEISKDRLKTILYFLVSSNDEIINKLYKGDKLMEAVKKQVERFTNKVKWDGKYYDSDEFFRMDVRDEIRNDIKDEVIAEVRNEVRDEVRNEVKDEVRNEVKDEITNNIIENMLHNNIPDDIIIKSLNISQKELDTIKEKIK